jgi:hypothetical protein
MGRFTLQYARIVSVCVSDVQYFLHFRLHLHICKGI